MTLEKIKEEIEERRLKTTASKLCKTLYDKNYSNITFDEIKNILFFIDKIGSKYLEFYKFKETEDKKTFISNLENYNYNPVFVFQEEEKLQKSYLSKTSNQEDFEIMFNFEVLEEEWVDNADKTIKTKQIIHRRRVLYIHNIGDYVILSIDPIGIGRAVGGLKHLEKYKTQIEEILRNPLFDKLEKIDLETPIKSLLENIIFTAKGVKYEDSRTARETTTVCKNSQDNLKDIIVTLPENMNMQDLKLKYGKISLELFDTDLLKITSRANEDIHDEIKNHIIQIL